MKGYKGMNKDMTCRGMKYEIGKTYYIDGDIKLCRNGFHFCKNPKNVFDFYQKDKSRYFEIEAKEPIKTDRKKSVTATITILRELDDIEINRIIYGYGNGYGYGDGYGYGYGDGNGNGYGYGYGYGYGNGNGDGIQRILLFK